MVNPLVHWKTTLAGVAALLGAIARSVQTGKVNPEDVATAVAGIGLIFASDADKTSTSASSATKP